MIDFISPKERMAHQESRLIKDIASSFIIFLIVLLIIHVALGAL